MAQPIEIVIRKTQESNSQSGAVALKGDKKSNGASLTDKAITNALINAGKSIANYGVAQFGNMTGYAIAQRNIENALNVASYVTQIATTGWVGAIAVGIQLTTQGLNTAVARDKANQQAALLYQRSGNITIDGGRGTYD